MTLYESLKSNNGLRGLFCVFFVATILTIYEIYMFYTIITPKVKEQVDDGIKQVSDGLDELINSFSLPLNPKLKEQMVLGDTAKNTIDYITSPVRDMIDATLQTIEERELRLTNKINDYTKITGFLLIIVLIIFLFSIKYILNRRKEPIGICTWKIAITTIVLIFLFQYSFYIYGNKYKYLGTLGKEELIYYLVNQLDDEPETMCS